MEPGSDKRSGFRTLCVYVAKRIGPFMLICCVYVVYLLCTNMNVVQQGGKHVLVQIDSSSNQDNLRSAIRQIQEQNYQNAQSSSDSGYMVERVKKVNQNCLRYNIDTSTDVKHLRKYLSMDVYYCGVPKTSTKFWKLLLGKLNTEEEFYLFNGTHSHKSKSDKKTKKRGATFKELQKESSYKLTFARDPYSRVFSSYIDKLFAPNPFYYNLARRIVLLSRGGAPPDCPIDVQFREVIHFLNLNDPTTFDRHFKPVSLVCDVCNLQYDAIGKAETFKRDVMHILDDLKAVHRVKFTDFTEEGNVYTIIKLIHRTDSLIGKTPGCMIPHAWHQRLWRTFQIYGWIDTGIAFPWTETQSEAAEIQDVSNLFLLAYHNASLAAKANKHQALVQAYSQVSRNELEQFRQKYLNDFLLFDYEDRPEYLYNIKDDDIAKFDFFDVL